MIIVLPLLVALLGLLMFLLCANPDLKEIGRLLLFSGVFVFLLRDMELLVKLIR